MPSSAQTHTWKFYRIGGLDQVAIETAEDLLHLHELDPKLWVALSCPVRGLELDEKTLSLIDSDKDGKIRIPEVLAAVAWASAQLKDPALLLRPGDELELSAINESTPEGRAALASARRILRELGREKATSISFADISRTQDVFAATKFNGDGVLPPSSAGDPALEAVIKDILACVGGKKDRSAQVGVDAAGLKQFFEETGKVLAWLDQGRDSGISVLGDGTAAAVAAYLAVRTKVADFFARTRTVAFDARAEAALNRSEADYAAIASKELGGVAADLGAFPLARIHAGSELPLADGLNPAWAARIEALRTALVVPVFGSDKKSLFASEWQKLETLLAPYLAWEASKPSTTVEKLGWARVRSIGEGGYRAALEKLLAEDKAEAADFEAIEAVEQLLRYRRDLRVLLSNFVNFFEFYSKDLHAVFQAGTLLLDSRACELCIKVENPAAHAALAMMSKAYIAYLECKRPGSAPMTIAACFTQGDSDYLFVGRNGVFIDRKGQDWDAVVVRVVDNPISIGQAFWSPYKRVIRFVEDQVAKRAADADQDSDEKLKTVATAAGTSVRTGKAPEAKPKFEIGTVAALGVAVGGISTAFGYVLNAFFGLGFYMPLGLLGLMLVISGPAMIIAWLKLRQRNLGPLLEANGWAINGRVMINIPFGSALTEKASLPLTAKRSLSDPYEDASGRKARNWSSVVIFLILAGLAAFLWYRHTHPETPETSKTAETAKPAVETPAAPTK